MSHTALAELFYQEFRKVHRSELDINSKIIELTNTLMRLFFEFTKVEQFPFATLFARIAFACHKHDIKRGLQWRIHQLRKRRGRAQSASEPLADTEYYSSLKTVCFAVAAFCQAQVPSDLRDLFPAEGDDENPQARLNISKKIPYLRVMVLDCDASKEWLLCQSQDNPDDQLIRVKYNETSVNELFNKTIQLLKDEFNYKASANLIDILISDEGVYYPKAIILEPDYLMDVSGIAECFQGEVLMPQSAIMRKFAPKESSIHLALGNIANFFLDELMTNADVPYADVFGKIFSLDPMSFALFTDEEVRELARKAQHHFVHLQRIIKQVFPERGISPKQCLLEPSFYSEQYGLQGRLDIWQPPSEQHEATIIELKSGKPFKTNRWGINHNHYVQTILYDLLVQSVFKFPKEPNKYILYSGLDTEHLKYAPSYKIPQDEAIQLRNELVCQEFRLTSLDNWPYLQYNFLDSISPDRMPKISGFALVSLTEFAKTIQNTRPIERSYFLSFVSFIAREHRLTRTGIQGNDSANGQATLWLNPYQDKEDAFELLNYLKIKEHKATAERPYILFERTEKTNKLANFRVGDIVVVYPFKTEEDTVLHSQIFKGTIELVSNQEIRVGFRYKQFNNSIFESDDYWRVEPDTMDTSFNGQYQSLFAFLRAPLTKRQLLLTEVAPRQPLTPPENLQINSPKNLSGEQIRILQKVLATPDYFLLVGPPGTGKTKFMLAELARYLLNHTQENILLMAYTNRAVDEICDAIEEFASKDYLRLGSRNSTETRFHDRLFSVKTEEVKTRQGLKELIGQHRIFVATVAAVSNQPNLFKIKKFNTAIIDEASQILEPMLMGVLTQFDRFVLIGDHKQLPAVVQQPKERSEEKDVDLRAIGLVNRRNSLFERLYQRAQENKWGWAMDMLQHQGRMHEDIMKFPSQFFYNKKLLLLPDENTEGHWQKEALAYTLPEKPSALEKLLAKNRMVYLTSKSESSASNRKINHDEAEQVAKVVEAFQRIYIASDKKLNYKDLGVITPFRAQIANIRQAVEKRCGLAATEATIDTVERYQGGAREIIIISLCMNTLQQMENVVSLSDDEQVDRKLNVALTRARQHLVIIGNEDLMRTDRRYGQLLDFIEKQVYRKK